VSHVLKPIIKSTIMIESFPTLRKKKKHVPRPTPKPRTTLVQRGENDMNITLSSNATSNSKNSCKDPNVPFHSISNIAIQEDMNYDEPRMTVKNNVSKLTTTLFEGGEDNMAISTPTTIAMTSINPIHIQLGTLDFELKIEDENNMVPVAPCPIKLEGINFIKGDNGHIMTKLRTTLLQWREDDELMTPQIILASNQKQRVRKNYKEYNNLGRDLMKMWRRPASTEIRLQTHPN
jgi:hypothetical protein